LSSCKELKKSGKDVKSSGNRLISSYNTWKS